jgi:hypothetical protein
MDMSAGKKASLPPVRVRIAELRLEGFDPRHRFRIAAAVERELGRLIAAARAAGDGAIAAPAERGSIDGGSFAFRGDDSPASIGTSIARATFRGIAIAARGGQDPEGQR